MSLLRYFRHGPLVVWLTIAALGAVAVSGLAVAGFDSPGPPVVLSRADLIDDVSALRGQLGSLLAPGQDEDATTVAESARQYAQRWEDSPTAWGGDAQALFADIAHHAERIASGEGDRDASMDAVLADGDGLVVIAFGGSPLTSRSGTQTHPGLDEVNPTDGFERIESDLPEPEPMEPPSLSEFPEEQP